MRLIRLIVSLTGTLLLAGGYFASQWAYFQGEPAQYVARLDASPVPWVALALLVAVVALAFVPDRDAPAESHAEATD